MFFNHDWLVVVNFASFLCILIVGFVVSLIVFFGFCLNGVCSLSSEKPLLELIWTVVPTFWVSILCFYNVSGIVSASDPLVDYNIKILGRQWYWSFENVLNMFSYDSYIGNFVDSVDKPLVIYLNCVNRLLITSSDVIHSFFNSNLGVKMDAIPGRINSIVVIPHVLGSFTGYCSELCGVGHGYMPAVVEVVPLSNTFEH